MPASLGTIVFSIPFTMCHVKVAKKKKHRGRPKPPGSWYHPYARDLWVTRSRPPLYPPFTRKGTSGWRTNGSLAIYHIMVCFCCEKRKRACSAQIPALFFSFFSNIMNKTLKIQLILKGPVFFGFSPFFDVPMLLLQKC